MEYGKSKPIGQVFLNLELEDLMKIRVVCETASAEYMYKIFGEFRTIIEPLGCSYQDSPFDMDIVFRCREASCGFKTFQRFSKVKNILHVEIAFNEEDIIDKLKAEQRFIFGHTTYDFLSETLLERIKNNDVQPFLNELRSSMHEMRWLEDEVDYSNSFEEDFV